MSEAKRDDSCACCGGPDYRRCGCPWGKPFENWPQGFKDKLRPQVDRPEA